MTIRNTCHITCFWAISFLNNARRKNAVSSDVSTKHCLPILSYRYYYLRLFSEYKRVTRLQYRDTQFIYFYICIKYPRLHLCQESIELSAISLFAYRLIYLPHTALKTHVCSRNVYYGRKVYGSVHRKYIPIYIQQDATSHSLFISENCSTCFGLYHHPSSGAQTTLSTASGICHTVTATCRYGGR